MPTVYLSKARKCPAPLLPCLLIPILLNPRARSELQVIDQCPSGGSADCDTSSAVVGCLTTSVAGRIGSSYAARLTGPETVSGTVEHTGAGLFAAEYIGPVAGEYELEVRYVYVFLRVRKVQEPRRVAL